MDFYFRVNFYRELSEVFDSCCINVNIKLFKTGVIEITKCLQDDLYAGITVDKNIRLEFYQLKWKSERYQMRKSIAIEKTDLPFSLTRLLVPSSPEMIIDTDNPIVNIIKVLNLIKEESQSIINHLNSYCHEE